jgi:hypothetical protein
MGNSQQPLALPKAKTQQTDDTDAFLAALERAELETSLRGGSSREAAFAGNRPILSLDEPPTQKGPNRVNGNFPPGLGGTQQGRRGMGGLNLVEGDLGASKIGSGRKIG